MTKTLACEDDTTNNFGIYAKSCYKNISDSVVKRTEAAISCIRHISVTGHAYTPKTIQN